MKKDFFYSLHFSNINTPPPYLYELVVNFTIDKDKVQILYTKTFLDRDQFTDEELEEEGFSTNDDSQIEAELQGEWLNYFKSLISNPNWSSTDTSLEDFNNNYISLTQADNSPQHLILNGIEYQLEEILQALVESLEIEAPLSIIFRQNKAKVIVDTELYWSFKNRAFEIRKPTGSVKTTWEEGQKMLSVFYETDLSEQQVYKKQVPENVICINPGDGLWYQTPKSAAWKDVLSKVL
jgi:hypothetical protein